MLLVTKALTILSDNHLCLFYEQVAEQKAQWLEEKTTLQMRVDELENELEKLHQKVVAMINSYKKVRCAWRTRKWTRKTPPESRGHDQLLQKDKVPISKSVAVINLSRDDYFLP